MSAEGPSKILVLRFNALGDVAMTIPLLWAVTKQFPQLDICLVSRPFASSLIKAVPRAGFFPLDLKNRHRGIPGIFRLFRDLRSLEEWDAVADLHDVLRTRLLRLLFQMSGVKTVCIDKGRIEKKKLTRKKEKVLKPLKTTVERYTDVFRKLGFQLKSGAEAGFVFPAEPSPYLSSIAGEKTGPWIGIAPFAKHRGKSYPLDKLKKVIEQLLEDQEVKLFLFGGGPEEERHMEEISLQYGRVLNLSGKSGLEGEIGFMSSLDILVSMDSANMHLASLAGIPVLSIWGATHPFAGFYGWNQSPGNAIQTELFCRPCSVFGDKPCWRKDYACLEGIEPETITMKIRNLISSKP